jgi:hypothetical protein
MSGPSARNGSGEQPRWAESRRRPTRAQGGAQRPEYRHVFLLGAVAERGEDVEGAVEPALRKRLPEVVPEVAQSRGGQVPAFPLGMLQEGGGLVDAQDEGAPLRQGTREPAVATGGVQHPAPFAQPEERPDPLDLRGHRARCLAGHSRM